MSTTDRYLTLSVFCLLVECTRRQRKGNSKKKHSDSCRPVWLEMGRKVCPIQLLLLEQKEVELLYIYYYYIIFIFNFLVTNYFIDYPQEAAADLVVEDLEGEEV